MSVARKEPVFGMSTSSVMLSIVFFPIGIIFLLFFTYKYLAEWMCYNFNLPKALCYISALLLAPIFVPLVILSFIFKFFMGKDKEEKENKENKEKIRKKVIKKVTK